MRSICAITLLSCAANYGMRPVGLPGIQHAGMESVVRVRLHPDAPGFIRDISHSATAGATAGLPQPPSAGKMALVAAATGAGVLAFISAKWYVNYKLRQWFPQETPKKRGSS